MATCTVYAEALRIFAICAGLRAYDAIVTDISFLADSNLQSFHALY